MPVIDADAHVVESSRTWEYMEGADRPFRPTTVRVPTPDGRELEQWVIDGRLRDKGPIAADDVTRAQQEMEDIPGRLRHMDELGTDVQVLYPTIFLRPITARPEVEVALYRSYNRWLASIFAQGGGRLRWAVMAPVASMGHALDELRFGKENGACGVFLRPIEGDRSAVDPYYFPLFQAAEDLDLPICFHAATGSFTQADLFPEDKGIWRFKLPGLHAFHALLMSDIPERFPHLRFGFVELSAQWVPYVIHDYARRMEKRGIIVDKRALLEAKRIFVACQLDDDLAYVLSYAGDGHLVMGTDYGHFDNASELEALRNVQAAPGVSREAATRIVDDNARVLYAL